MLTRRSAVVLVAALAAVAVAVSTTATCLTQAARRRSLAVEGAAAAASAQNAAARASAASAPALRFRADGAFQLAIFEDLHFGENAWDQWGPEQDRQSVRVMDSVLDAERGRVDLAVLNGDLITGENTFRANSTTYLDQVVGPLVRRALPWASTYGNHDSDFNLSRADLLAREQRLWPQLARTQDMVSPQGSCSDCGVTNYYLPVYGSDCPGTETAATAPSCTPHLLLWFFDSRGGFAYQQADARGRRVGLPNWVDARVAAWFEQTHAALQEKHAAGGGRSAPIPSLAFVHIPPNVAHTLQAAGVDPHRQPGINDDKPLAQQAEGWCADGHNAGASQCPYGGHDAPFMRAVATAGNGTAVVALFSGHDHGDTWCHTWDAAGSRSNTSSSAAGGIPPTGIHICFGQHSGYGGYGRWTRGARMVRVTEAGLARAAAVPPGSPLRRAAVDTWVRLETGDAVGAVTLNTTYGSAHDVYPATPNTHTRCPTCQAVGEAEKAGKAESTDADTPPKLHLQDWVRYLLPAGKTW